MAIPYLGNVLHLRNLPGEDDEDFQAPDWYQDAVFVWGVLV